MTVHLEWSRYRIGNLYPHGQWLIRTSDTRKMHKNGTVWCPMNDSADGTYPTEHCALRWYALYGRSSNGLIIDRRTASRTGEATHNNTRRYWACNVEKVLAKCTTCNRPVRTLDDYASEMAKKLQKLVLFQVSDRRPKSFKGSQTNDHWSSGRNDEKLPSRESACLRWY